MAQENNEPTPELEAEVDKAIENVLGSQAEAPVSEQPAQEVAEPDVPPEQPEPVGGMEAAAAADDKTDWFSDTDKELAQSYGVGVEDFTTRDEFSKFTRLLDKQLLNASAPQQSDPPAPPAAEPQKPAPSAPASNGAPETKPKFNKLDLEKLKEIGHDETTLAYFATLNELIDDRELTQKEREAEKEQFGQVVQYIQQSEQRWQAIESQRAINSFHQAMDRLGDDSRFGRAFDEHGRINQLSKEQNEARQKVFDAQHTLREGHIARGLPVPSDDMLVIRARNVAFAESIAKDAVAKRNQEIADQSKKRRPVQQARSTSGQFSPKKNGAPLSQRERVASVADEVRAYHDQLLHETNGAGV